MKGPKKVLSQVWYGFLWYGDGYIEIALHYKEQYDN